MWRTDALEICCPLSGRTIHYYWSLSSRHVIICHFRHSHSQVDNGILLAYGHLADTLQCGMWATKEIESEKIDGRASFIKRIASNLNQSTKRFWFNRFVGLSFLIFFDVVRGCCRWPARKSNNCTNQEEGQLKRTSASRETYFYIAQRVIFFGEEFFDPLFQLNTYATRIDGWRGTGPKYVCVIQGAWIHK